MKYSIWYLKHYFYIILVTAIKQSDVDDVREVLRYYKQYDDPIEAFRENQRKLQVIISKTLCWSYQFSIESNSAQNRSQKMISVIFFKETLVAEEQLQKEKQAQSQGLFSSSLSSLRRFGR